MAEVLGSTRPNLPNSATDGSGPTNKDKVSVSRLLKWISLEKSQEGHYGESQHHPEWGFQHPFTQIIHLVGDKPSFNEEGEITPIWASICPMNDHFHIFNFLLCLSKNKTQTAAYSMTCSYHKKKDLPQVFPTPPKLSWTPLTNSCRLIQLWNSSATLGVAQRTYSFPEITQLQLTGLGAPQLVWDSQTADY